MSVTLLPWLTACPVCHTEKMCQVRIWQSYAVLLQIGLYILKHRYGNHIVILINTVGKSKIAVTCHKPEQIHLVFPQKCGMRAYRIRLGTFWLRLISISASGRWDGIFIRLTVVGGKRCFAQTVLTRLQRILIEISAHLTPQHILRYEKNVGALLYIHASGDLIGYKRDCLYYLSYYIRTSGGVVVDILKEDAGHKGYEISLIRLYIVIHLGRTVRLGKRVRVLTRRQQEHLYIHPVLKQELYTAQGCLDTGSIGIINESDIGGEPFYEPHLLHCERGTRRCHHIAYPRLMHGYHVHIPLDNDTLPLLRYCLLRLVKTVQLPALGIDVALRGVDILCHGLVRSQCAASECHDLARKRVDRIYHTSAEPVIDTPIVSLRAQSGGKHIFLAITALKCILV